MNKGKGSIFVSYKSTFNVHPKTNLFNMKVKSLFTVFALLLTAGFVNAQVSQINYQVKFNPVTNLFDGYLLVKKGTATSMRERVQLNAQFTVVVPSGSNVEVVKSYMPLQNNQNYEGSKAAAWTVSNVKEQPFTDPFNDYVSIIPNLSPSAFYNDLKEGDAVKLFSFKVNSVANCGTDIKIYDVRSHLSSSERGMSGGDFSNGFTMGGIEQKYAGNTPAPTPTIEVIKAISSKVTKQQLDLEVKLNDAPQYGPFSYEWNGPNGFKSYEKDIKIKSLSADNVGVYTLEITDNRGCKEVRSIEPKISVNQLNAANLTLQSENTTDSRSLAVNLVQIYPNPANGFFNLSIDAASGAKVNVDLLDVSGRVISGGIFKSTIQNNHADANILLNTVPAGIYNVNVTIDGEVSTHKLIVVK